MQGCAERADVRSEVAAVDADVAVTKLQFCPGATDVHRRRKLEIRRQAGQVQQCPELRRVRGECLQRQVYTAGSDLFLRCLRQGNRLDSTGGSYHHGIRGAGFHYDVSQRDLLPVSAEQSAGAPGAGFIGQVAQPVRQHCQGRTMKIEENALGLVWPRVKEVELAAQTDRQARRITGDQPELFKHRAVQAAGEVRTALGATEVSHVQVHPVHQVGEGGQLTGCEQLDDRLSGQPVVQPAAGFEAVLGHIVQHESRLREYKAAGVAHHGAMQAQLAGELGAALKTLEEFADIPVGGVQFEGVVEKLVTALQCPGQFDGTAAFGRRQPYCHLRSSPPTILVQGQHIQGNAKGLAAVVGVCRQPVVIAVQAFTMQLLQGKNPGVGGGRHQVYLVDVESGRQPAEVTQPLHGLRIDAGIAVGYVDKH